MNTRLWATLSLVVLLALAGSALAGCPKSGVHLPSGNLSRALIALGRQCRISVLVQAEVATSITVNEQHFESSDGAFEPALHALLQGTPLTFVATGNKAVAVIARQQRKGKEKADDALPASPTEELVVTGYKLVGSHLHHLNSDSYGPVDVLTHRELKISGAQTVAELLKYLPAVSGNSTSTSVGNGGNGTATVTLRGLPANNTLVLINGRRIVSDGFGGEAADLNSIPLSAVERIEVLKDGASAVYGSDAIAGVVNIIFRRDFEGLSLNSYLGQSERGDLQTEAHNLTWGASSDNGHLMFSLAQYSQGALLSRDRPLSASADNRVRGGTDLRSSASPSGFIAVNGEALTHAKSGGYRAWTEDDLYNFRDVTASVMPSENQSVYLEINRNLGDRLEVFAEAMSIRTRAQALLAPTPVFTRFDDGDLVIAANNIYNPFGHEITDVRKRVLELGPREQSNRTDTWRFNTGFKGTVNKGTINQWQWQLTAATHYTRGRENLSNLIDPLHLANGLKGPELCRPPSCVPINLLGPSGSIDKDQLDYIRAENTADGVSRMALLTYIADGILGQTSAGDILAAAGVEIRRESIAFQSTDAQGLSYIGGASLGSALGERLIGEAFTEVSLPLRAEQLWIDAALRYSDYSDVGNTINPKLALRWQPWPILLLRASYTTGFRAPTLMDMHQSGYQSQEFLFDPCASKEAAQLPGCTGLADQLRNQYLTEFIGNPNLEPETSSNFALGLMWRPRQLAGFNASLDVFDLRQQDVIGTIQQHLIDANTINGSFSDSVLRDSHGDIIRIIANQVNVGARKVRGMDVALHYQYQSKKLGALRWSLNSTYMHHYLKQPAPGAPLTNLVGTFVDRASGGAGSLPHWKGNMGAYWQRGRWESGYTIHYVGALEESFSVNDQQILRRINSWASHDLQLAYAQPSGFRLALGIDNLLDQAPPFAATAFNDNFDSRTYNLTGRYWYTALTISL